MILVDAQPIAYRAFHAYDLSTSRGEPTNIIYGVLKILKSIVLELPKSQVVTFWDSGRSKYRAAKYPEYKRSPAREKSRDKPGHTEQSFFDQIDAASEILRCMGVRQVRVPGVEADDLIAIASGTGDHIVVADDMDLWQLADTCKVYAPRKDMWITRESCFREVGCYPEQILDYKSLAGDTSDNIPGVPGVGDKTALSILAVCGSVPALYQKLHAGEKVPVGPKLAERILMEEQNVKLWYDIVQPLTWDMLSTEDQGKFTAGWAADVRVDRAEIVSLLEHWELRTFLSGMDDLVDALAGQDSLPPSTSPGEPVSVAPSVSSEVGGRSGLTILRQDILGCTACTVRAECNRPVPGILEDDSERPDIMIIGRNPGLNEDREGRPFIGNAGRRLDQWLTGLDRHSNRVHEPVFPRAKIWVTNSLKCHTAADREPSRVELETCAGMHLRREIGIIQPRIILTFGAEAMTAVTGLEQIMKRAGTVIKGSEANGPVQYSMTPDGERRWDPVVPDDTIIIPAPHPAACLRPGSDQAEAKLQQCGQVAGQWIKYIVDNRN